MRMQPQPHTPTPAIDAHGLSIDAGGKRLVDALDFSLAPGDWLAILGRNGVGKTLTLETLCGLRAPATGKVTVCGSPIEQQPARQLAQKITLVTQHQNDAFATSVIENVLLGRYPHLGLWQRENAADREAALQSLAEVALADFADRDVTTLSGGERQRAAIAQCLTQNTPVIMLDEPLSHLDPSHAGMVVKLLAKRAEQGNTVISSLHDINIAARWASHTLMLFGDGRWRFGKTTETLDAEALSALYDAPVLALKDGDKTFFVADTA